MDMPKDWFTGKVNPDKLGEQAIDTDRWDRDDLSRSVNSVPPFAKARRDLEEFTPTGRPALNDVFWALLKAEPGLVDPSELRPSHLVNRTVADELLKLDELEQLRHYSVNDDVQAALSASILEPDVEIIFDRLKKQQEQADELQKTVMKLAQAQQDVDEGEADLDAMMASIAGEPGDGEGDEGEGEQGDEEGEGAGSGDSDEEGKDGDAEGDGQGKGQPELTDEQKEALDAIAQKIREAQERRDELKEQAEAEAEKLGKELDYQAPVVQAILTEALDKATADARETQDCATSWGLEPGELKKMNAQERMELARRLNSDRFKKIADLFGPMRNIMFSEQARKTTNSREEIFDVESGNDLAHLLPSELLNLDDDLMELDFLRRYSERSLMQYALQGSERLARGGIIFCEDGSGSMSGQRELWAKAVMLCLLHLARQQKRTMHVFHFGSPGQIKHIPFVEEADFTIDRILTAAELFFNGGTDFVTPMKASLKVLQDEFAQTGGVRADIVFVTDDECWVDDDYMKHYLSEMHRMDATTWGISVTGQLPKKDGALHKMCEGKTATIKDFASGGEIREVFRGAT